MSFFYVITNEQHRSDGYKTTDLAISSPKRNTSFDSVLISNYFLMRFKYFTLKKTNFSDNYFSKTNGMASVVLKRLTEDEIHCAIRASVDEYEDPVFDTGK